MKYLIGICILLFSLVASASYELETPPGCKVVQISATGGAGYGVYVYALATCIIPCPYDTNAKCVVNKVFKIK